MLPTRQWKTRGFHVNRGGCVSRVRNPEESARRDRSRSRAAILAARAAPDQWMAGGRRGVAWSGRSCEKTNGAKKEKGVGDRPRSPVFCLRGHRANNEEMAFPSTTAAIVLSKGRMTKRTFAQMANGERASLDRRRAHPCFFCFVIAGSFPATATMASTALQMSAGTGYAPRNKA